MVEKLAIMQRQYVDWGNDSVEIEQELEFVKAYLSLQKYRFGDRLNYNLEIDPECAQIRIPKLTIVTFVENACVHGIESKASPGWIFVRVYKREEQLCIEIEDTGSGIEEQKKGGEKKNGAGKNKEPETAGWHQDYREAGNRNMQSLGYDLIVDDDGIIQEAGKIVEKTEDFEQKLGELSDILSNVLDDAIMQGNTAENLMLFADEVQGLRSEAQEIAEQVRRAVENYVTSMDEADSYVY